MIRQPTRICRSAPAAFTMFEALLAIAIAAMAGSVLLLGMTTSLQTTNTNMYGTIAMGLAQQLMDETVGNRYCELGVDPYQTTLGPSSDETTRQMYDDVDDYNGLRTQPPKDFFGIALGKDDGAVHSATRSFRRRAVFSTIGNKKWTFTMSAQRI